MYNSTAADVSAVFLLSLGKRKTRHHITRLRGQAFRDHGESDNAVSYKALGSISDIYY